ncbi:hypothetical protein QB833_004559 [Salmonella enterica]|nr:hypothetical protein [Salmonella enterica]
MTQFISCISKRERVFESPEHPQNDPLDPFTLEIITSSIRKRLPVLGISSAQGQQSGFTGTVIQRSSPYPNQGWSSLCSAAAVFYCLQQDRPDLYRQIILDLWNRGETLLDNFSISPRNGCCHPTEFFVPDTPDSFKISPIDWITLASLRDSDGILTYSSPEDKFSGITQASTVIKWFWCEND